MHGNSESHGSSKAGERLGHWLKKIFPGASRPTVEWEQPQEQRKYFRLSLTQPVDAALILGDGTSCHTTLENLSAGGFSCELDENHSILEGYPVTAVFVLPAEEPQIIRTEAIPVARMFERSPNTRIVHFSFTSNMQETDSELIHRYIIESQFEMLQQRQGLRQGQSSNKAWTKA